jgi:hypothetical protein
MGDEDDDETGRGAKQENTADSDADFDNDVKDNAGKGYHDGDDGAVLGFGHAANASDRRAIASVVKRYYAAAATGDGGTACKLSFSLLAESLVEDYAHTPGPLYLRGLKTCPQILTKLFSHIHAQLTEPVAVTGVRVSGRRAYAILGWRSIPAGKTELRSENGVWKIDRVLSERLP